MSIAIQSLVQVDTEACNRVAEFITSKPIPPDQEDSRLPGFARNAVGNLYLALVAICHQTSPRGCAPLEGTVAGIRRRGWDYLFAQLEEAARTDLTLLEPRRWASLSADEIRVMFRDSELGERLSNPELRSELLRDLGHRMMGHGWRWADDIYQLSDGRIGTGEPNLLQLLAEFRAYSDPVRKKSLFYLALMRNAGLWQYVDEEQLGTPVDYHEVRGHLRLGTVRIIDESLQQKVLRLHPVSGIEDVAIRQAVYDAIMLISERSGLRHPSQLHYLFWNVFRSICTRESPQCFQLSPTCSLPARYMHLTELQGGRRCPFSEVCESAGHTHPICEHVFETDYY
jgi:hypothetical protein